MRVSARLTVLGRSAMLPRLCHLVRQCATDRAANNGLRRDADDGSEVASDPRPPAAPSGRIGRPPRCETRAGGGEPGLAEVRVGENETFESALRRFNKKIQQSGILAEARRREHYEKPSVKRKRKEAKRKKNARTAVG